MYSNAGCPVFSINPIFKFFPNWLLAFCFLIIGPFTMVKGRAHILKVSLAINTMFMTITMMLIYYHVFFGGLIQVKSWVNWVSLIVILLISGVSAFSITKNKPKVSIMMVSSWCGIVSWILFCTSFQNPYISFVYIFSVLIGIGCVYSFKSPDWAMIVSTSLIGSYLTVRSITLIAGEYPNELTAPQQLKAGIIDGISIEFYAYLALIILCTIGAAIYQRD